MSKTLEKEKKSKLLTLVLGPELFSRLKDMAGYYNISQSALVRELINQKYAIYFKDTRGYMAGSEATKSRLDKKAKEARRQEQIDWVKNTKESAALTAYLIDCGYIEEPERQENDMIVRVAAEPNDTGLMMLRQRFFNKATGEFSYASDLQTIEEVVKGLIKEKRI